MILRRKLLSRWILNAPRYTANRKRRMLARLKVLQETGIPINKEIVRTVLPTVTGGYLRDEEVEQHLGLPAGSYGVASGDMSEEEMIAFIRKRYHAGHGVSRGDIETLPHGSHFYHRARWRWGSYKAFLEAAGIDYAIAVYGHAPG
jgi:hypothetical protein